MNIQTYKAELRKIIDQRNGYLVLASGLLILCLILSILVISLVGRERIVLMPPSMSKDIWVAKKTGSQEYFSRMTLFLAELVLNVTTDNVDYQQALLLRYVDPSVYPALKTQLTALADKIKHEHISTAFFPVDVSVDVQHSAVIISGDLKSYVADTALPTKRIAYRFTYRINTFTPLITAFEEVKHA
jgi:conjugal transfer pilus assembly protein TraE